MTEAFPPAPAGGAAPVISMRWQWRQSITRPIRAFQLNYVPVVMVYFAYGALGLIDVTRDLWIIRRAKPDARRRLDPVAPIVASHEERSEERHTQKSMQLRVGLENL